MSEKPTQIAIIGTGYVGLTTGVVLADIGHSVICVDNNPEKLEQLKKNQSPIFEPGLEDLLVANTRAGRLKFTDNLSQAVKSAEAVFICVNTPPKADGQADLSFVENVASEIADVIDEEYKVVVDKSTVPVKTAELVAETINRKSGGRANIDVVSNPEFLREGSAIKDTLRPDRIVIGTDSQRAKEVLLRIYAPIIEKEKTPVKIVSVRSAELIKHGANTFLALKISYANLIAEICEQAGANAREVLDAVGMDERIGHHFLRHGIGFGGSCFPKDITAFQKTMEELGVDSTLVKAIDDINQHAVGRFIKKIEHEAQPLEGKKIAILGLSFKPNTDDIRNAAALKVIDALQIGGAELRVFDPKAMQHVKKLHPNLTYAVDAYAAVQGCEAAVICTEWPEFEQLDLEKLKASMAKPILFDGRNVIHKAEAIKLGFTYFGVGE